MDMDQGSPVGKGIKSQIDLDLGFSKLYNLVVYYVNGEFFFF